MLRYTIATGKNATDILATYGVNVKASEGLVGRPDLKNPIRKYDWDYLNGEWVDLNGLRYESRDITLKCWLKGSSEMDAVNKMNNFIKAFQTNALIRLAVTFLNNDSSPMTGNNTLYYLVRLSKSGKVNYKWHRGKQMLHFDFTLNEPSPVKRVYKVVATDVGSVTIAYSCSSEIDIHWGDGVADIDNMGNNQSISHSYKEVGTYILIVTGVISDIAAMTVTGSGGEIVVTQLFDEI